MVEKYDILSEARTNSYATIKYAPIALNDSFICVTKCMKHFNLMHTYIYYQQEMIMNMIWILLFFIPLTLLHSNTTIAKDNFDLQIDKIAHLSTSFGLYFFFHTMYSDSLLPMISDTIPIPLHSMLSSTIVGLSYEVYQSTPYSKSDGFSIHDMIYNLVGIGLARFTHEVFLYIKG